MLAIYLLARRQAQVQLLQQLYCSKAYKLNDCTASEAIDWFCRSFGVACETLGADRSPKGEKVLTALLELHRKYGVLAVRKFGDRYEFELARQPAGDSILFGAISDQIRFPAVNASGSLAHLL